MILLAIDKNHLFLEERRGKEVFNFFSKPISSRHASNVAIVKRLRKVIDMYPELRFVQLLYATGILDGRDLFYEESAKTLEKIEEKLGGIKC